MNSISSPIIEVSVILPVNRVDQFFHDAVISILQQTFINFELIIVANACSDDDFSNMEMYLSDCRVTLLRTKMAGLPFALNYGIHYAKGKYIARMDGDDISLPTRLAEQYEFLTHHPNLIGVSSAYALIDENGNVYREGFIPERDHEWIRKRLPLECCLAHPTMMIDKSCLLNVGGYAYGKYSEDYDLWLRLQRSYPDRGFYRLGVELLHYRRHSAQATSHSSLKFIRRYNFALRIREFLLTGNLMFILGNLLPARLVHKILGQ